MPTNRRSPVPKVPTLPRGVEIAGFEAYLDAQRAVDHLSDKGFPVQHATIVGTDLRMVERITGRLTTPRVAAAGAMTGAWFGSFVGLIFGLMSPDGIFAMLLPSIVIGAVFGVIFGLVSYAFSGGNRDFTSSSQVVAARYALLVEVEHANAARQLLREGGMLRSAVAPSAAYAPAGQPPAGYPLTGQPPAGPQPPAQSPTAPGAPASAPGGVPAAPDASAPARPAFAPLQDEHGNPRYGRMLPAPGGEPGADPAGAPADPQQPAPPAGTAPAHGEDGPAR